MKDSTLYSIRCGRPNPRTGRRPVRFLYHQPEPFGLVDVTMYGARHYKLRRTKHDGAVRIDPHQVLYDQTHNGKLFRPLPNHKITTLRSL